MGTRRKHLGVAVYNNMIYAVGGRDDTTELSSAERYNPQTNTWQAVVAMTSRRSGVCVYCIGSGLLAPSSQIYCFGPKLRCTWFWHWPRTCECRINFRKFLIHLL